MWARGGTVSTSETTRGTTGEAPQPDAAAPSGLIVKLAVLAMRAPRITLAIAAVLLVCGGALGSTLTSKLSAGGFVDPHAESTRAGQVLDEHFGLTGVQMLFTVTAEDGALGGSATQVGRHIVEQLRTDTAVASAQSAWDPGPQSAALVSKDGRIGAIVVSLRGDDNASWNSAHRLDQRFAGTQGSVAVAAGGPALMYYEINHKAIEDGTRAEMITLPISLILLALLLRSVLAAAVPVITGLIAIGTTTGMLALLAMNSQVSAFAVNIAGTLGLALSIDYSLLIINRFREYLDEGHDHHEAILLALHSSGRAVVFSGVTVALSMIGLLFFPMYAMRSMAIAGFAVIVLSVLLALTCMPALLSLFAPRIERRRRVAAPVQQSRFYRVARFAQRRAVVVSLVIVCGLVSLGIPLSRIDLGLPDDRVLSSDTSVHQVGDALRDRFTLQLAGTISLRCHRSRSRRSTRSSAMVRRYRRCRA